jgi:uncharacterized protein
LRPRVPEAPGQDGSRRTGGTDSAALDIRGIEGACLLRVRLTPNASSNRILGIAEGALRLSIQAPPVEGAANAKAREFLAKALGISRSAVSLERGQASRDKLFRISGLLPEDIRARLMAALP